MKSLSMCVNASIATWGAVMINREGPWPLVIFVLFVGVVTTAMIMVSKEDPQETK